MGNETSTQVGGFVNDKVVETALESVTAAQLGEPLITPEVGDYGKAKRHGIYMPGHQKTTTESVPASYFLDVTASVNVDSFFGSAIPIPLTLPKKVFPGVLHHVAVAIDITVTGGPIQFVATPFWTSLKSISENLGKMNSMIDIYPEVELLWLQSCVKTEDLHGTMKMLNFSTNLDNFLGPGPMCYPGVHRFYILFESSFINRLRVYNQAMEAGTIFKLSPVSNIVSSNPGGLGSYEISAIGFQIETKKLTWFDQTVTEGFHKVPRGIRYLNTREIPLATALTISATNGSINPLNINTQNLGGRIIGFLVTFRLNGASNTGNGYMSQCVHPGDMATVDLLNGAKSLINEGIPITIDYLDHQVLNSGSSSLNNLRIRHPYSVFVPLTKSISAAFNGCPRGFRFINATDTFTLKIVPTTMVPEVQVVTKSQGGYAYTAGSWVYVDPVTNEVSPPVAYNAAPNVHAAAIQSFGRAKNLGWAVQFNDAFNDASPTVSFTITSYLSNGVGGPIKIIPSGIVCNGLSEFPTVSIGTKGVKGFAPGMGVTTVLQALYVNRVMISAGRYFFQESGRPEYPDAQTAIDHVLRGENLA